MTNSRVKKRTRKRCIFNFLSKRDDRETADNVTTDEVFCLLPRLIWSGQDIKQI